MRGAFEEPDVPGTVELWRRVIRLVRDMFVRRVEKHVQGSEHLLKHAHY